jgi:HlyD family secretion protein
MDRALDPQDIRKRQWRRGGAIAAILAIVAFALSLLLGWVRPSVNRSTIRIATVTRGPLAVTLEGAGTVVPSFEQVVSSPVEARVMRVLRQPGASLHRGDPIVELDLSQTRLELQRIEQQLAQKRNEAQRGQLVAAGSVAMLQRQMEQKKLDLTMLHYRAEQNRKLRSEGLVSEDVAREAAVAEQKADIEVRQLEAQIAEALRTAAVDTGSNALERDILEREREQAAHQMELATMRADRDGVLTWVTPQEGVTMRRGDVVARISDLATLRVRGTISDVHAASLRSGLPVDIKAESGVYRGRIASVDPTAAEGTVTFLVDLDDARVPLHNKQRVDLYVITDQRSSVLKVKRGSFADSGALTQLFVVRGDDAIRQRVRLGAIGYDEVEIVEGVREGDVVITSDMRDYEQMKEVRIRK